MGFFSDFFKDDIEHVQKSLLSDDQQEVHGYLAEYFEYAIEEGWGLEELGELFKPGFLDPLMNAFNQIGGGRDQINASFASIGGTLGSRREQVQADAVQNIFSQASGQFIQQAPSMLQSLYLPFQGATQFALTPTVENIVIQNPSMFANSLALLTAGSEAYGAVAGAYGGGG